MGDCVWGDAAGDAVEERVERKRVRGIRAGDVVVWVDERYFRPAEVETVLGCAEKAEARRAAERMVTA